MYECDVGMAAARIGFGLNENANMGMRNKCIRNALYNLELVQMMSVCSVVTSYLYMEYSQVVQTLDLKYVLQIVISMTFDGIRENTPTRTSKQHF